MFRQDFTTITDAVKHSYLELFDNQIGLTPGAFVAAIKKVERFTGKDIASSMRVGMSGSFGFGAEGTNNAPMGGGQMYDGVKLDVKDMYATIEISDKAMKLSKGNSFADAMDEEMKAVYKAIEYQVARSVMGDGTGALANVVGYTADDHSIYVDSYSKLKEGIIIDFYTGTPESATAGERARRIMAIDRTPVEADDGGYKYKVVLDRAPSLEITEGFITLQNSLNRELTGLGAIIGADKIYGLDRTNKPYLRPSVYTLRENEHIDDGLIDRQLRIADRDKGAEINMLLCSDTAYEAYVNYLRSTNQRHETDLTLNGGFKAIRFSFGKRDVAIVNDEFVSEGEIWGVNTEDFEFHKTGWDFVTNDGSAFTRIAGSSNLQALLACYGNIICKKPGAILRLTNIAA